MGREAAHPLFPHFNLSALRAQNTITAFPRTLATV
jgi:hypothetical protein